MALNVFTIPISNVPQTFEIELNGKAFNLTCRYNTEMASWLIGLSDVDTATVLFDSMPLVTGANLLTQHAHINIIGSLIVYTDGDEFATPTAANLGIEANLYYAVVP